jgi:uncharacterized protein (TIGR02271 family)
VPTKEEVLTYRGHELRSNDDEQIGTIEEIYLDDQTGQPEWALVNTGLFGTKRSFVPLTQARQEGEAICVPYGKQQVKDSPTVDPDGELSQGDEAQLYRHYGLEYSEARSESGLPEGQVGGTAGTSAGGAAGTSAGGTAETSAGGTPAGGIAGAGTAGTSAGGTTDRAAGGTGDTTVGRSETGPSEASTGGTAGTAGGTAGTAEDAMTRSEEELAVGTREQEAGRVRLRKYVETEDVQETVPVRREEARVEREPITDENVDAATSGPEISEAEHEVVLHEEEPVAEKRAVPKERVRLDKDVQTEEQEVSDTVRQERIDVDDRAS